MDEVDGMSTGDEGGISALISVIKISKIPIICICNDRYASNIKSLANVCLDIKFTKCSKVEAEKIIKNIANQENLRLSPLNITKIVESANGDIRVMMNTLEMIRKDNSFSCFTKDSIVALSGFEAANILFDENKQKTLELDEKLALFISDYELISGFVIENYPDFVNLSGLSEAADALALSDCTMKRIKTGQEWTLLPDFVYSNLLTTSFSNASGIWPQFPQIYAKNSIITKNQRLLQEFKHCVWPTCAGYDENVDYYRELLIQQIICSSVEEKLSLSRTYRLDKNIIKECMIPFVSKNTAEEFAKLGKQALGWLKDSFKPTRKASIEEENDLNPLKE